MFFPEEKEKTKGWEKNKNGGISKKLQLVVQQ